MCPTKASTHSNQSLLCAWRNRVATPPPLQSATKFPDFSPTEFYFFLTKILCFYGLFLVLQPIHDQFSLPSSPILEFKKKKKKKFKRFWGKHFLINHYNFLIVSSEGSKREKNQHFQTLKNGQNICYNPSILAQIMEFGIPWLSKYLKFPWPICKIPWLFPDLEEKSNFPDQWPPWETLGPQIPIKHTVKTLIRLGVCSGWSESSLGA